MCMLSGMVGVRQSNVFAILEAASYPLTQPQLNSEVGADARRSQQVTHNFNRCLGFKRIFLNAF